MTDHTAIIAERDEYKRRAEAAHAANESMVRQLEEERAAKASAERVAAKLEAQVLLLEDQARFMKAELARMKADREFSV